MPESLLAYSDGMDFEKADLAKKSILELYKKDIEEQVAENANYIRNVFNNIPSELSSHEANGYCLSHVDKNARMREYQGPLKWLEESMIANFARNCKDPSPP